MTRIIPTNKNNACPICDDATGDCRVVIGGSSLYDAIFCHTYADARKGEKINGHICTKEMGTGHTATFLVDNSQEWTEENKIKWEQERERRSEQSKLALERKIENQLSAVERDKYYRNILNQLPLIESDRTSLKMRGLSDLEIKCGLYRSVKPWQKIKGHLPANLPGLLRGHTLNTAKEGILCPIFNIKGLIIGLKVRKVKLAEGEKGRYFWLTSKTQKNPDGQTPHLDNELPLSVYKGSGDLCLVTEGVEIKPYITHCKTGLTVLGGGRYWHKSPKQAEVIIENLKSANIVKIGICPDAGDILNNPVLQNWKNEAEFFQSQGFEVVFEWHEQVEKDSQDIDELDSYENLNFVSFDNFLAICEKHKKTKQEIIDDINWNNWLQSRIFKAIRKVEQDQFGFPKDTPEHNAIIAVKSGLGTGKTEAMLRIIAGLRLGSIILGYRNNLLFQTINRAGEYFVVISHINEDGVVVYKEEISLSCCINSAHKLKGMFDGRTIFIDETVSVLLHTIDGGTFTNYEQKRAMEILEAAVKAADRVFLLDGNLTDDTVNFIHSFDKSKELFTIENTKKIPPHKIIFCDGGVVREDGEFKLKPRAKSHLIEFLSSEDCRPFIAADSKKFAHELQEYLITSGKCGIVISADTVHEKYAKEFLANPNLYIRTHKPQFVIITPSCESGVSITEKYFTAKFSFFCGVLGTSSQHQMMFRLRDNTINHYVYCPRSSLIRDNSIPQGYSQKAIESALLDRINLASLMTIDIASFDQAAVIIKKALEQMQEDKWFNFACKLWGLANYERRNLRKCLMHSLREAGHDVSEEQWLMNSDIEDEMSKIKEELLDKEAKLQYEAIPFESLEKCKEYEKEDISIETKRRIIKTKLLLETLPGIDQEECYGLELFKRKVKIHGYISQHQNYARLVNFEVNQRKMEEEWFHKTTSEYSFIANLRYPNYTRIAALHELKILDLIKEDKKYSKESPELVNLFNKVNNSKELLTKLNITKRKETKDKKEIIELFKQLLAMIGLELGKAKKKLDPITGKRLPHYFIDWEKFNDPIRQAIVKLTSKKDLEWLETHQVISWEMPVSMASEELAEKYRNAIASQNYTIYFNARQELESSKYIDGTWGLTSDQVAHNEKVDQILDKAWGQLQPQEQKLILNMRPAGANFIQEIDAKIKEDGNYSDEYMSYQSANLTWLWERRLIAAVEIGKNFAERLINAYLQIRFDYSSSPLAKLPEHLQAYYASIII